MKGDPKAISEISADWKAFEARPFPEGHRGKEIKGKGLTLLQSEMGGYIMTYLHTDGSLSSRHAIAIKDGIKLLDELLPELSGEGKEYFARLKEICEKVSKSAHNQPFL